MRRLSAFRILLVEDNPGDAELMRDALERMGSHLELGHVYDGVGAIERLRNLPLPHLIFLDLNLPRMSGTEVLEEVRGDHELRHIPIVVLTSSSADNDIIRSYQLGANCYVTKPIDLATFQSTVSEVGGFWLNLVRVP